MCIVHKINSIYDSKESKRTSRSVRSDRNASHDKLDCFCRKHPNLVLFWKIFNSLIYVLVNKDTINNSERYFICEICNLGNTVTNCKKTPMGSEIFVISRNFLKYGSL